jgi:hypothetical protein
MADMTALQLAILGAATATCSLTLSKSSIFSPLRAWAGRSGFTLLRDLLDCPFCLAHWFAVAMVVWAGLPVVAPHTLALISVAALLVGATSRLLFIPEHEKKVMKEILGEVHAEMAQLRRQLAEKYREIAELENDRSLP